MNLDQTKCDHCGKIYDTPYRFAKEPWQYGLVRVLIPETGRYLNLDYCNEDCLRQHLIKRAVSKGL